MKIDPWTFEGKIPFLSFFLPFFLSPFLPSFLPPFFSSLTFSSFFPFYFKTIPNYWVLSWSKIFGYFKGLNFKINFLKPIYFYNLLPYPYKISLIQRYKPLPLIIKAWIIHKIIVKQQIKMCIPFLPSC